MDCFAALNPLSCAKNLRYLNGTATLSLVGRISTRNANVEFVQIFFTENFSEVQRREIMVVRMLRNKEQLSSCLIPMALIIYLDRCTMYWTLKVKQGTLKWPRWLFLWPVLHIVTVQTSFFAPKSSWSIWNVEMLYENQCYSPCLPAS